MDCLPPRVCGHSPSPQVWPHRSFDDTGSALAACGGGARAPGEGAGAAERQPRLWPHWQPAAPLSTGPRAVTCG